MKHDLACLILLLWVVVFTANCGGDDPDGNDDDDAVVDDDDDDNDDDTNSEEEGSFLSYTYTFSCTDCPDVEEGYDQHVTFSDSGSFASGEWAPVNCVQDSQSVKLHVSNKEYGEDCSEDSVKISINSGIYHGPDTYEYRCQCREDDPERFECENEGYVSLTTHILQDGMCYNTVSRDFLSDLGIIYIGPSFSCYSYSDYWADSGSIGCSVQIQVHNESKLSGIFSCYQTLEEFRDQWRDTWNTKTDLRVEGEFQCVFNDETEED